MADEMLPQRVSPATPDPERVASRAQTPLPEEHPVDDAAAAARALLEDSDARVADPAVRDHHDARVERRTSEDATPPLDV